MQIQINNVMGKLQDTQDDPATAVNEHKVNARFGITTSFNPDSGRFTFKSGTTGDTSNITLETAATPANQLANNLLEKNPVVLRAAKIGFKRCRELTWEQNEDYLYAKLDQSRLLDTEGGREQGMKQFLDEKSIKPGLQAYKR